MAFATGTMSDRLMESRHENVASASVRRFLQKICSIVDRALSNKSTVQLRIRKICQFAKFANSHQCIHSQKPNCPDDYHPRSRTDGSELILTPLEDISDDSFSRYAPANHAPWHHERVSDHEFMTSWFNPRLYPEVVALAYP